MMKLKRFTVLLALTVGLCLASACVKHPEPAADPTPVPSEAVGSPSGEDVTPAADVTNSPSGEDPTDNVSETPDVGEETLPPLPEKSWFVDEAWKLLSRVGEVHGIKLDKATAYAYDDHPVTVSFSEGKDGIGFNITFLIEDGEYFPYTGSISVSNPSYEIDPTGAPWSGEHLKANVTITPKELQKAGCTETEGEGFVKTLGRLYAEKMLERYQNEPEDSPLYAKEVRLISCKPMNGNELKFRMVFSMRGAKNIPAVQGFFDSQAWINDGEEQPELFGWLDFGGEISLHSNPDGTWSAIPLFNNPG